MFYSDPAWRIFRLKCQCLVPPGLSFIHIECSKYYVEKLSRHWLMQCNVVTALSVSSPPNNFFRKQWGHRPPALSHTEIFLYFLDLERIEGQWGKYVNGSEVREGGPDMSGRVLISQLQTSQGFTRHQQGKGRGEGGWWHVKDVAATVFYITVFSVCIHWRSKCLKS